MKVSKNNSKQDNINKKIGERLGIARHRVKGKLTQKEVAKKLNIARENYTNIENGNRKININQLIELCKILNTSSDYLLGLADEPTKDVEIQAINKKYGLTEKSLTALCVVNAMSEAIVEINTINYLLEDLKERQANSIIASISNYLYLDTNFKITQDTKIYGSDFPVTINLNGEIIALSFLKYVEERLIKAREHIKKEGEKNECKRNRKK